MNKVLIAVGTFNRRKVSELTLLNLSSYNLHSELAVWDDHSTEYSVEWLRRFTPHVRRVSERLGCHGLRGVQLQYFLRECDHSRIYLTDNDTLHDPMWMITAELLLLKYRQPVCLFNSKHHAATVERFLDPYDHAVVRKTCPGVSIYMNRTMVESIASNLNPNSPCKSFKNWDFELASWFDVQGINITHSRLSYLEHYGASGLHNRGYFEDTAITPTHYLKQARDIVLPYLIGNETAPSPAVCRAVSRAEVRPSFEYNGFGVQQSEIAFHVFRFFLGKIKVARVLEIGTGGGGMSLMIKDILCECHSETEVSVLSVDVNERRSYRVLREWGIDQQNGDLADPSMFQRMVDYIGLRGVTVVLCDGSNPGNEFRRLAPYLKPGDFILAHDYAHDDATFNASVKGRLWNWFEVQESDIVSVSEECSLEQRFELLFNPVAWVCKQRVSA